MYISFFKLLLGKLWRAKLEKNRFSKEGYKGFVYDFYMTYYKNQEEKYRYFSKLFWSQLNEAYTVARHFQTNMVSVVSKPRNGVMA